MIASSPLAAWPPSANPATAANTGFLTRSTVSQRLPMKSSAWRRGAYRSFISLMSAPAANAFSLPVSTMAPIPGSSSNARSWPPVLHQRIAQGIQRGGTIEPDRSEPPVRFNDDVLIIRHVSLALLEVFGLYPIAGNAGNRTCCAPTGSPGGSLDRRGGPDSARTLPPRGHTPSRRSESAPQFTVRLHIVTQR